LFKLSSSLLFIEGYNIIQFNTCQPRLFFHLVTRVGITWSRSQDDFFSTFPSNRRYGGGIGDVASFKFDDDHY
ncbi:hypothetical protein C0J52_11646, partial [Blattella germanica]